MSRHTLNDGVTPDSRITADLFDMHCPELAPSPRLIGDYYKRGLQWSEFELRFHKEIQAHFAQEILRRIAVLSYLGDVTLLCIEDSAEFCHRRILVEECLKFQPKLVIEHH